MSLQHERENMVRRQLAQQGIHDRRVLQAMAVVPRHHFVPPEQWTEAYAPRAVPIGHEQTISQPFMVALMTQQLSLQGRETVLEVGTGSGYQAAVLSRLVPWVVTVERIPELAVSAWHVLRQSGASNVEVVIADGSLGAPVGDRFERILVTAAAPRVPETLLDQLADPGILVCPVGDRNLQVLHTVVRRAGTDEIRTGYPCRFVPLLGGGGFPERKPLRH